VILQGEAAEGVLDRLRVGVPRNAQDLVVVALLVGRDGGIPFLQSVNRRRRFNINNTLHLVDVARFYLAQIRLTCG
jgi:hypothetical protein